MPLTDSLRELLMTMARQHQYLPTEPTLPSSDVEPRADEVVDAAITAVDKLRDEKTLTSHHLHRAVRYCFLTGIDDAYAGRQAKPRRQVGPRLVFHGEPELAHVRPDIAALYYKLDMPAKLHNAGFQWILDNRPRLAEAGVAGNDCVRVVLRCAYVIGFGRAERILRAESQTP